MVPGFDSWTNPMTDWSTVLDWMVGMTPITQRLAWLAMFCWLKSALASLAKLLTMGNAPVVFTIAMSNCSALTAFVAMDSICSVFVVSVWLRMCTIPTKDDP